MGAHPLVNTTHWLPPLNPCRLTSANLWVVMMRSSSNQLRRYKINPQTNNWVLLHLSFEFLYCWYLCLCLPSSHWHWFFHQVRRILLLLLLLVLLKSGSNSELDWKFSSGSATPWNQTAGPVCSSDHCGIAELHLNVVQTTGTACCFMSWVWVSKALQVESVGPASKSGSHSSDLIHTTN